MEGIYLKICRQFSELTSGAAVDLCVELVTCWVFGRKCTEDGRIHLRAIGIKSPGSATLEGGGTHEWVVLWREEVFVWTFHKTVLISSSTL